MVTSLFLNSTKLTLTKSTQVAQIQDSTDQNTIKKTPARIDQETTKNKNWTRTKQNTQNAKGLRGSAVHRMLSLHPWEKLLDELLLIQQ